MSATTNLRTPQRPRWIELSPPVAAAICIFILLAIAALVGQLRSAPSAAAVPTPALPAPIIIIASPLPQGVPPTAVPVQQVAAAVPENVTQRPIGVFGGPDTASYIGSVEAGRAFVPVASYGANWTQVDMAGGTGRVFVRTSDLYGVPPLVDLQPPPQPQVVYQVVNRPIVVEQSAPLQQFEETVQDVQAAIPVLAPAPATKIVVDNPLRLRAEDECNAEHGRCTPPCTSEHGRCAPGDK